LGKETILRLAKHSPGIIYLCSRDVAKGDAAIQEIKAVVPGASIKVLELDLNTLPSVAAAAAAFKSQSDRLDVLINNAGIMAQDGKTEQGYEKQLGVNHLGHALFTKLLLPTMLKTASDKDSDVRIINLSSGAHTRAPAPGFDPNDMFMAKHGAMARYSRAKLANVLFAKEMAKRYPQIKTVALHPGVIRTNLFDPMMGSNKVLGLLSSTFGFLVYSSVEDGAKNTLWAATAPKAEVESGAYYVPVAKKDEGSAYSRDEKMADSLWQWTEAELKKQGYE
jgi:NAD(P)-dependent dehydrogenase (short-subunit alcohol dehydrogenase family)